jgi:HEAT repeat protein
MKMLTEYEGRLKHLGLASKECIPLFVSRSGDDNVKVRRAAVLALRLVGCKDVDAAVPALTRAAKDSDGYVRGAAVAGLGEIGPSAAAALDVIVGVLESDDQNNYIAARALGKLGAKAEPAVSSLTKALDHRSPFMRESAAEALGCIGPKARASTTALRKALRDVEPHVRLNAAYALWTIERSNDGIKVLTLLLDSKDHLVVLGTIEAIGDIGPSAEDALPALEKVRQRDDKLNDRLNADKLHAVAAAWAIGKIQKSNNLVDQLMGELENEDAMARIGAAWALGKIGPDAREAIPGLRKLYKGDPILTYGFGILYVDEALKRIESSTGEQP